MPTLAEWETLYPWIDWREPIELIGLDEPGWACRACFANDTIKGEGTPSFATREECQWHIDGHQ